ncbi:MAG: DUF799 domain-containing protein [Zoogloeaceae bacterium]|jgi:hypothetical protein|nr:DUF799 domain-containing protein [Zoogloeaceae bacterium]
MNSAFNLVFPVIHATRRMAALAGIAFLLSACGTTGSQYDYTAFRESKPRSILVLPPINQTPEVKAKNTFLATSTIPLAESGYYVIPVTLAEEAFKQNGVNVAEEAHAIAPGKLREIFGADAALYITITRFGVRYVLVDSVVEAAASARLIDLRTGQELWSGQVSISQGSSNNNRSLVGMLVSAAFNQIVNSLTDKSYGVGRDANQLLLYARGKNKILYGPYHPKFGTD